jgi:hypothetical protein
MVIFEFRDLIHKFYVPKPVKLVEMKEIFKNLVENTPHQWVVMVQNQGFATPCG